MDARSLTALSVLNDLKAAWGDLLLRKRKHPALLMLYCFIDICASLAHEGLSSASNNASTFQGYLRRYATFSKWERYTPYDLWAARSSLLHAFSPFGHHTGKVKGARPIFYLSWPETAQQMGELLQARGYRDFVLLDTTEIKSVAINAFNSLISRVENDPPFAETFATNAEHLLADSHVLGLRQELDALELLEHLRSDDVNDA